MTRSRGSTLFSLIVVVVLVIFLVLAAIENLLPLRGDAERAAVLATVGQLQSATGMETLRRVVDGERIEDMHGANPVDWLITPMQNYVGDLTGTTTSPASVQDVPPGHWAYIGSHGILFYRVRYAEYFEGDLTQPPAIRWRVMVQRDANGRPMGVSVQQLDAAQWNTQGSELARWIK